jgi:hypothetical protein
VAVIPGSCLCGGVRFELLAAPEPATHCHCSRCRKTSGTYGSVGGRIARDDLRILAGEELLRVWQADEEAGPKVFCVRCGSTLFGGEWPDGPVLKVRFGALDADPGARPVRRIHVASAAPWLPVPDDNLERCDEAFYA